MVRILERDQHFHGAIPIGVVPIDDQEEMSLHSHNFWELVIILAGAGEHETQHGTWTIRMGDVFVIRPGEAHAYHDTNDLRLVNILFDKEALGLPIFDMADLDGFHALFLVEPGMRRHRGREPRLKIQGETLHEVEHVAWQLREVLIHQETGYQAMAFALLIRLICLVSQACSNMRQGREGQRLLRLGRIFSHIDRHLATSITLADLCRLGHMSESTLLRAFRAAVGMTPIQYVNYRRIQRAAEMLQQTDRAIETIAEQVGISDANYFSRLFRRYFKCSPSAYRRQQMEDSANKAF